MGEQCNYNRYFGVSLNSFQNWNGKTVWKITRYYKCLSTTTCHTVPFSEAKTLANKLDRPYQPTKAQVTHNGRFSCD